MSRKFVVALLVTALAALLVVGVASAAGPGPDGSGGPGRGGRGGTVGQVVSIDGDQITIEKLDGTQVVVSIDENTRFLNKDSDEEVSLVDIEVGMWIGGRAQQDDAGNFIAVSIAILPDDFDPEAISSGPGAGRPGRGDRIGTRGFGTVVSVVGDTLTIETEDGETIILVATDETRFLGQDDALQSMAELKAGDTVGFGYAEAEDGTLELHAVGIGTGEGCLDGVGGNRRGGPGHNGNGGFGGTTPAGTEG